MIMNQPGRNGRLYFGLFTRLIKSGALRAKRLTARTRLTIFSFDVIAGIAASVVMVNILFN